MSEKILWADRKRHLGLPISFTKYKITDTRLFIETGFLNLKEEEIQLYRITDISLTRKFGQRIFGVGSIQIFSSDKTSARSVITNVKSPKEVKELLFQCVEKAKLGKRMNTTELLGQDTLDNLDTVR